MSKIDQAVEMFDRISTGMSDAEAARLVDAAFGFAPPKPPIICAWCEAEAKRTVVGYSDVEGSHGICDRHAKELAR